MQQKHPNTGQALWITFLQLFSLPNKKPSLTVHVRKRPPKHEPQTQQQMNSRNTFEAAYRWPSPSFKLLFFGFHWGNVQSCFCCQLYAPRSQNRFPVLLMKEHFLFKQGWLWRTRHLLEGLLFDSTSLQSSSVEGLSRDATGLWCMFTKVTILVSWHKHIPQNKHCITLHDLHLLHLFH